MCLPFPCALGLVPGFHRSYTPSTTSFRLASAPVPCLPMRLAPLSRRPASRLPLDSLLPLCEAVSLVHPYEELRPSAEPRRSACECFGVGLCRWRRQREGVKGMELDGGRAEEA